MEEDSSYSILVAFFCSSHQVVFSRFGSFDLLTKHVFDVLKVSHATTCPALSSQCVHVPLKEVDGTAAVFDKPCDQMLFRLQACPTCEPPHPSRQS